MLSLISYKQLLEKCNFEIKKLSEQRVHPDYDYMIFNLVMGINHLFDWFLKEESISEENKVECVKSFNPYSAGDCSSDFKKIYEKIEIFPETNSFQKIIRELCNKAKHFNRKEIESQKRHIVSQAGESFMQCGEPAAACGNIRFTYTVVVGENEHDLEKLLIEQVSKWESFVRNQSHQAM